ncbi:MAG: hypothetical protein L0Y73_07780, partial [Candidatus Aminicenantes bacterium]|nr:hypothetical protein [Candidatus Aminicenantes bacterium]
KYLDQEIDALRQPHPGTEKSPQQSPTDLNYLEESKPVEAFKPAIAFTQKDFTETWKKQIVSTFNQAYSRVEEFSSRIKKFDDIKQWFTIIGRRLNDYPRDTEKSFFKNIYPGIKTLRSKLSNIEFEEFREIFFRNFLNTLEIEEFGRKGDQFNPEKHEPYKKSNVMSGGTIQTIQKVDMPGYKSKYSPEILEKALVEL